jgi:mono/diheme cytochrome c family protein
MKKAILTGSLFTLTPFIITEAALAGDIANGKAKYETLCLSCHGATGLGDGPIGAALPEGQKPRNLQDKAAYKFATDDAKLAQIIKHGGGSVGLSMLMPAQGSLSDAEISDLVAYVKSLQK